MTRSDRPEGRSLPALQLLPLPAGTGRVVFQKHTACREVLADAVRGGEVAAAARRVALLDQPLDLLHRHSWLLILRPAEADDPEDAVEPFERLLDQRHIVEPDGAGVDRGVQLADELEDGAERRGGVQVVA